ncbi:MAG: hypothetical protein QM504_06700 [Pseudomonadota bacterium]
MKIITLLLLLSTTSILFAGEGSGSGMEPAFVNNPIHCNVSENEFIFNAILMAQTSNSDVSTKGEGSGSGMDPVEEKGEGSGSGMDPASANIYICSRL